MMRNLVLLKSCLYVGAREGLDLVRVANKYVSLQTLHVIRVSRPILVAC